ncbi:uncharacterized protein BCR38DRAFT_478556 [Pseudomassariella vexata]|uniref:Uncharacterized protein n=1 Tax=Pseudomassariella vexata TaxID=1141098 RepID=A0A1Y2DCJ2_9PEZI|nr:uncharacterized protein BCR38DRAFT_478556 [Pseudomassariella vexata]ORY56917.1 hypothetical protein BCR38DRAFT_478556 [Pseudomassariella vexata]
MTNSSSSSSDSSGGGAPLRSIPASPKQGRREQSKSDSPTDDEMALVRASSAFHQIGQCSGGQGNNGQGNNGYGNQGNYNQPPKRDNDPFMSQTPSRPARPVTAFQNRSPYVSTPATYRLQQAMQSGGGRDNSQQPVFQESAAIQQILILAMQYLRITPGVPSHVADNIQSSHVDAGQRLNGLVTRVDRDYRGMQYEVGEARLQVDRVQKELDARKKQVGESQAELQKLARYRESQDKKIKELEKDLRSAQEELKRVREQNKRFKGQDESHLKQVQGLENEIKSLRMSSDSKSMALVKVPDSPLAGHNSADKNADTATLMPMLLKYSQESGATQNSRYSENFNSDELLRSNLNRPYAAQDARSYGNSFSGPSRNERPGTRMGYRNHGSFSSNQSAGPSGFAPAGMPRYSGNNSTLNPHHQDLSRMPTIMTESGGGPLNKHKGLPAVDDYSDTYIPRNKENWNDQDITAAFTRLYGLVEGYVANEHCNAPFKEPDVTLAKVEPLTWEYILAIGLTNRVMSANHMTHLLGQEAVRHYVIKRMIVEYIFKKMIQPQVFLGFSPEVDSHLRALQERMRSRFPGAGPGRPQGKQRQRIIEDHAKVVQHIITTPEGKDYRTGIVERHSETLLNILRPLRNSSSDEHEALKSIRIVVNAAWAITSKIWCTGVTVHFFFPETGSKFSFGQMRPMNHLHMSPEQMQYSQYRVMLVVVPTLSLRDDRDLDSLRTAELMKADVLVMK